MARVIQKYRQDELDNIVADIDRIARNKKLAEDSDYVNQAVSAVSAVYQRLAELDSALPEDYAECRQDVTAIRAFFSKLDYQDGIDLSESLLKKITVADHGNHSSQDKPNPSEKKENHNLWHRQGIDDIVDNAQSIADPEFKVEGRGFFGDAEELYSLGCEVLRRIAVLEDKYESRIATFQDVYALSCFYNDMALYLRVVGPPNVEGTEQGFPRPGSDALPLYMRGCTALAKADFKLVEDVMGKALQIEPNFYAAKLAYALAVVNRAITSKEGYDKAMALSVETMREGEHPRSKATCFEYIGWLFEAQGCEKQAYGAYRRSFALWPKIDLAMSIHEYYHAMVEDHLKEPSDGNS